MNIRRFAAALTAALSAACPSFNASAASACTPFGNEPQPTLNALTATSYALTRCPDGGTRLTDYVDGNGTGRLVCFWDNAAATVERPLPLVVYLQASFAPIDSQIGKTGLLAARIGADLSGDPDRPGFLLMAPLPRYTHHYYAIPNTFSLGFDVWHRQFGSISRSVDGRDYPPNVDFATIDHYIAELLDTGRVDARRIYLIGYSNGASAAIEYAQNRPAIAAAALYSAPDPYGFLSDPCQQQPVAAEPASIGELQVSHGDVPIFHLHRNCDVYGSCPSALKLGRQLSQSATASLLTQTIDRDQQAVPQCDDACGTDPNGSPFNLKSRIVGVGNHNHWPDAWTARMLDFLRQHPLQR